jgi:mono/diheme cytochrome c family protein
MTKSIPALLLALVAAAPCAHAQQAGGALNDTQLLGRQVFAQSCGVCHLAPSMDAKTYGPLLNKATGGGNDEVMRTITADGTPRMPAFKYYLSRAEMDAIIAYMRTVPPQVARVTVDTKGDMQ